ncbi:MAG: hypothetical protein IPQ13_09935 [Holophagaceae bacterium]|nr:hypothetical protein [Holophagaceae bacterium]
MDQARRIGHHILIERVALDPFGSLHRAVKLKEEAYDRHALVRLYNGEVLRDQGFDKRLHKANWVIHDLPREWSCGQRWRIDDSQEPLLSCDFSPGLTLAAAIRAATRARRPMPPRFVLAVLQRVATGIRFLDQIRVGFGVLNPHMVWLGFDGCAHLLDAPMAPFLAEGISKMPEARMAMLPFLGLAADDPGRRDLFQLGTLALAALTLASPPGFRTLLQEGVPALKRGHSPVPEPLRLLVARLLGLEFPFPSLHEGVRAIETLAFDPGFECGAVDRALILSRAHPELFRRQQRQWKREARADWNIYLRMEKTKDARAAQEDGKGGRLLVGVTG